MADDVAPGLGPFATYHVESKFLVTGKLPKKRQSTSIPC